MAPIHTSRHLTSASGSVSGVILALGTFTYATVQRAKDVDPTVDDMDSTCASAFKVPNGEKKENGTAVEVAAIFYGQADHRMDGKDFAPLIVDRGHDGKIGEPPRKTTSPGVNG